MTFAEHHVPMHSPEAVSTVIIYTLGVPCTLGPLVPVKINPQER